MTVMALSVTEPCADQNHMAIDGNVHRGSQTAPSAGVCGNSPCDHVRSE
jgi:hypothetical protein